MKTTEKEEIKKYFGYDIDQTIYYIKTYSSNEDLICVDTFENYIMDFFSDEGKRDLFKSVEYYTHNSSADILHYDYDRDVLIKWIFENEDIDCIINSHLSELIYENENIEVIWLDSPECFHNHIIRNPYTQKFHLITSENDFPCIDEGEFDSVEDAKKFHEKLLKLK